MQIKPLRADLEKRLEKFGLVKKFAKAKVLFELNPRHPSLNTELLEPKDWRVYSFRIDRKFRVNFIYVNGEVEIVAITLHYQ